MDPEAAQLIGSHVPATKHRPGASRALTGYLVAAGGVVLVTLVIQVVPGAAHIANISMLYLLVVIGSAVGFGSAPAVAASFLGFLAFNWFFTEPYHTFRVHDPAEWIALITFLVTAVVTGQLTALLGARAEDARRRERETAALAEASWAVASQVDLDRALAELLNRLADVAPVKAAAILVPGSGDASRCIAAYPHGETPALISPVAFSRALAQSAPLDTGQGPPSRIEDAYLPLMMETRTLGVLYLRPDADRRFSPQEERVVQSLASQAAIVLERDRLLRAETEARALAEADRLKTALLSMVSHDFRSPLTSIKASVTGLLQDHSAWDPATQRELLQGIDQETDRLNGMVGNILALSRLESNAWRPRREPAAVPELVGASLDSFGADENRRLHVRLEPDLPEVSLDAVQIVQVLRNLVDNALKYSPPEAAVELHAAAVEGALMIEVMDLGSGLPPGEEDRIFEPFYRAPQLRETSIPGVGIGLAVCRGLVEAHHGSLSAEARPGGGTVFRILLPLSGSAQ